MPPQDASSKVFLRYCDKWCPQWVSVLYVSSTVYSAPPICTFGHMVRFGASSSIMLVSMVLPARVWFLVIQGTWGLQTWYPLSLHDNVRCCCISCTRISLGYMYMRMYSTAATWLNHSSSNQMSATHNFASIHFLTFVLHVLLLCNCGNCWMI